MENDLVSRQAAIDAIEKIEDEVIEGSGFQYEKWKQFFMNLPSAQPEPPESEELDFVQTHKKIGVRLEIGQPEIIRCKDCKWKQGAECVRFAEIRIFPDDFCSRGERRADG